MLARAMREIRGERSRREVRREIKERTGVMLSSNYVYRVETGDVHPRVSQGAKTLLLAYPQLAEEMLGMDVVRAICNYY